MKKSYSQDDLANLIGQIEKDFGAHLKKFEKQEGEDLQKSENIEETYQYDEEDHKEMDELYAAMDKSEAESHLNSLKKALGVEELSKSEENKEDELLKSELDAVKQNNEELKKSLETVTEILKQMVNPQEAPERKTFTSEAEIVEKPGEMKKSEETQEELTEEKIHEKLSALVKTEIKASDRQLINDYYLSDDSSIDKIKHLL